MNNNLKQTVMKTKQITKLATVIAMFTLAMIFSKLQAQPFDPAGTNPQTLIEERKGDTSTYSVVGPQSDEYAWQVTGAEAILFPTSGVSGDAASGFEIDFAAGQDTIQVIWPADDSTITSVSGNVSVQRRVATGTQDCPSLIQTMDIDFWSDPTATITNSDYDICNGDATTGDVTVAFTGAPNFDLEYSITDQTGATTNYTESDITGGTFTIDIPDNLANSSTTVDQTYVVTLTRMNDGFTGDGELINDTFTITIHPTIETGPITSDNVLTRNP